MRFNSAGGLRVLFLCYIRCCTSSYLLWGIGSTPKCSHCNLDPSDSNRLYSITRFGVLSWQSNGWPLIGFDGRLSWWFHQTVFYYYLLSLVIINILSFYMIYCFIALCLSLHNAETANHSGGEYIVDYLLSYRGRFYWRSFLGHLGRSTWCSGSSRKRGVVRVWRLFVTLSRCQAPWPRRLTGSRWAWFSCCRSRPVDVWRSRAAGDFHFRSRTVTQNQQKIFRKKTNQLICWGKKKWVGTGGWRGYDINSWCLWSVSYNILLCLTISSFRHVCHFCSFIL